jgi:hypothetical protein
MISAAWSRYSGVGVALQALTSLETLRLRIDPMDPQVFQPFSVSGDFIASCLDMCTLE